jgi:tRNA(Ile)-lysidine synthase TilS/MesJ
VTGKGITSCNLRDCSTALALLTKDWAKEKGVKMYAVIIDHNLRDTSKQEAIKTKAWLEARHIDTSTVYTL